MLFFGVLPRCRALPALCWLGSQSVWLVRALLVVLVFVVGVCMLVVAIWIWIWGFGCCGLGLWILVSELGFRSMNLGMLELGVWTVGCWLSSCWRSKVDL